MRKVLFEFFTTETSLDQAYEKPSWELSQRYPEKWTQMVVDLEDLINTGVINFRYHYVQGQMLCLTFYSDVDHFVSLMAPIADVLKLSVDFNRLSIKCMDDDEYQRDIAGKSCVSVGSNVYEHTKTSLNIQKKS